MPILAGKCALVTGASRGIGAAIVERLARDGAHVALTYQTRAADAQRVADTARAHGVNVLTIQADAADPAALRGAVDPRLDRSAGCTCW